MEGFLKNGARVISFVVVAFFFSSSASFAAAREVTPFIVDKEYDIKDRSSVEATLEYASPRAFFYLEKEYMDAQPESERTRIREALRTLADEFEERIYPELTNFFGDIGEGPDGNRALTVLFHEMEDTRGGYFNPGNLVSRFTQPDSNERNLVYLNIRKIRYPIIKSLLAHEFQHVISFYQKDKRIRQSEDVWLNELRSEYAATYLGYDDTYRRSNLEQRVAAFLENPSDSLVEWKGGKYDYGVVNVFAQYMVGQFGEDILRKSMQSSVTGIESLEAAVKSLGHTRSFSDIFRDWMVASYLNDCFVPPRNVYCYKNPNLGPRTLKIVLSRIGAGEDISFSPSAKPWEGDWYEFSTNDLTPRVLEFSFSFSDPKASFRIPYVVKRRGMPIEVHEFSVVNQNVTHTFENFGNDIFSIAVLPFHQGKTKNFTDNEVAVPYELSVRLLGEDGTVEEEMENKNVQSASQGNGLRDTTEEAETQSTTAEQKNLIVQLQLQIAELEQQLLLLIQEKTKQAQEAFSYRWNRDLFFGIRNDKDVEALQLALRAERVYDGPITGNFFNLTFEGVRKFQEKYGIPAVGRVGPITREKLNELYGR